MNKQTLTLIATLIFNVNFGFAQFEINYPKWFPAVGFKTLYIISPDTSTIYCKEVVKIVRDSWKLCPVAIWQGDLAYIDKSLLVQGNIFLDFRTGTTESTVMRDYKEGGNNMWGSTTTNDYYHMDISGIADKYNSSKPVYENLFVIGRAELYNRKTGLEGLAWEAKGDFTSALFPNDFCNGMQGNLRNMIQYFNNELPKNKPGKLLDDQPSTTELRNLKNDTLYLPNYWYGGKATIYSDIKENSSDYKKVVSYVTNLVTAYPYKIRIISRDELNRLILNSTKNIYYLNYIQSSADKIISVINGFNGNIIYSQVSKKSYRIKEKDLENIGKAIE